MGRDYTPREVCTKCGKRTATRVISTQETPDWKGGIAPPGFENAHRAYAACASCGELRTVPARWLEMDGLLVPIA